MQEFQQQPEQKETNEVNKKLDMYFHTVFRNVGLYTSLSFAALVYSRVHRGTIPIYDIVLIIYQLFFLNINIRIERWRFFKVA